MTDPATAADVELLAARLDELSAGLARLTADVEDLALVVLPEDAEEPPDRQPTSDSTAVASPVFASVDEWVTEYLAPTFGRPLGGEFRWCARWDEHAEALTRLEALWRSWEALRMDPNVGMATWLTTFLDPQLGVLMSRNGPFAQCSAERHVPPWRFPVGIAGPVMS